MLPDGLANPSERLPHYTDRVQVQAPATGLWSTLTATQRYEASLPAFDVGADLPALSVPLTRAAIVQRETPLSARALAAAALLMDATSTRIFLLASLSSAAPTRSDETSASSAPRLAVFGGDDGTRLLDDLKLLQLGSLSSSLAATAASMRELCAWRRLPHAFEATFSPASAALAGMSAASPSEAFDSIVDAVSSAGAANGGRRAWVESCGAATAAAQQRGCDQRTIVMQAWCRAQFQSFANL